MFNEMNISYVATIIEDMLERIVAMLKQCAAWFGWAKEAVTSPDDQTFAYNPEEY